MVARVDRNAALGQLPDTYAQALQLRDRGQSPTSIADTLAVDPAGIDTLLELADAKLSRILNRNPTDRPTSSTPGTVTAPGEPT
jgi:DNA-directed RNA polymerase specialized sigma24 family protein